jgi:putative acetyltransferase
MADDSEDLGNIVIRKMRKDDIDVVVDIWYKASIQAHSFIPKEYWEDNKNLMKYKYLPISDVYLAVKGKAVLGFIALVNDNLAAIFVEPELQGKGAGSLLLDYAKSIRNVLWLKVYENNKRGTKFYKNNGFKIKSKSIDRETREAELVMEWDK